MKLVKALLIMSVAIPALAQAKECKRYIRGQIGGSQGVNTKRDSLLPSRQGATKSSKFDLHGGLGFETRQTTHNFNPRLIVGYGFDVNLESGKYKQRGTAATIGGTLSTEVKRKVVVNALAHLAWKLTRDVRPYLLAGASYANFKFSNTWQNASTTIASTKNKHIVGWAGGAGVSWGLTRKWATDIRYLYTSYGNVKTNMAINNRTNTTKAPTAYHTVTLGVSYKL